MYPDPIAPVIEPPPLPTAPPLEYPDADDLPPYDPPIEPGQGDEDGDPGGTWPPVMPP